MHASFVFQIWEWRSSDYNTRNDRQPTRTCRGNTRSSLAVLQLSPQVSERRGLGRWECRRARHRYVHTVSRSATRQGVNVSWNNRQRQCLASIPRLSLAGCGTDRTLGGKLSAVGSCSPLWYTRRKPGHSNVPEYLCSECDGEGFLCHRLYVHGICAKWIRLSCVVLVKILCYRCMPVTNLISSSVLYFIPQENRNSYDLDNIPNTSYMTDV